MQLLSRVRPSATPWITAYQAPSSMGFSRQEYWSGVPLPTFCQREVGFQSGVNHKPWVKWSRGKEEDFRRWVYPVNGRAVLLGNKRNSRCNPLTDWSCLFWSGLKGLNPQVKATDELLVSRADSELANSGDDRKKGKRSRTQEARRAKEKQRNLKFCPGPVLVNFVHNMLLYYSS